MKKINIFTLSVIAVFMFTLLSSISLAYPEGHIGLLTVSESSNATLERGGVADLQLVIKPGTGRIFIDSFPLSKIDTQITMRFAAEMACDFLDKDCSNYDFFYTITANSAIVGGPSAGAAATVLTTALLDNQKLDNETIMTGTINSGNLIGPVAGVPQKTFAAQMYGYKRALIPRWDIVNNTPYDNLSIKIIPVSTLEDAMYYFTGKNYTTNYVMNPDMVGKYNDIMSQVTLSLCLQYGSIVNNVLVLPNLTSYLGTPDKSYTYNVTNSSDNNSQGRSQDNFVLALEAINKSEFYSAASFCFGGNVKIATKLLKNMTNTELKILYAQLLSNVSAFENQMDAQANKWSTIPQLETYMIVEERLYDTKDVLSRQNPDNLSYADIAYARERFNTAVIWSKFSELPGPKFTLNEELLKSVCIKKLSEAEERLNYLELYFEKPDIRQDLDTAYNYYNLDDYASCIFAASKVKSESDVVASALFVPENNTDRLVDEKLAAAQRVIAKEESHGIFPILGYSYYEYANTLRDTDQYSALLYAENSLELSNLDMYFRSGENTSLGSDFDMTYIYVLVFGFAIGALLMLSLIKAKRFSKETSKVKKRR